MDPFEALKKFEAALEKAERREERKAKNRAEWDNPAARREYVKEYKRKLREKKLPKNRVCPSCKKVVVNSRSWVTFPVAVVPELNGAVCRSCAMTKYRNEVWLTNKAK